jgi:UDP-GlcNAc:undecaprenyl-phosphate GlcNAc-1-phosphate transferase
LVLLDFILLAFAYYLSYRLRFEGTAFSFYFKIFLRSLPMIIACKLAVFFVMGVYRGLWSFISTTDVGLLIRASLVGSILSIAALTFVYRFKGFSKGVFLIDWIISTGLLLGVRGSFRMFLETQKRQTLSGKKVLIYGAGRAGELLLREILNNKKLNVSPIGFIDDDVFKKDKKIQGYQIFGTIKDIDRIHAKHKIEALLISFNGLEDRHAEAYQTAKAFCRQHKLGLRQFKVRLHEIDLDQDSEA